MKNVLLISVIIPMRNAESYISETLNSILQEKEIALEILLIDDASTDHSIEKVQQIRDNRIIIIDGHCQGIAAAFNRGLAKAQGDIIVRCDADDLYPSNRLKKQIEWLSKNPDFGAVCGRFATMDSKGKIVAELQQGQSSQEITQELCQGILKTHLGTYAIRRPILEELGGLRSYFQTAEDIDLQLRLGEVCRVWFLSEIMYYYRLHDDSITHQTNTVKREFFDGIAREFQQQRLTQGSDALQQRLAPSPPTGDTSIRTASEQIQGMLIGLSWQEHQQGKKLKALLIGFRAVLTRPSSLKAWRNLIVLAIK